MVMLALFSVLRNFGSSEIVMVGKWFLSGEAKLFFMPVRGFWLIRPV